MPETKETISIYAAMSPKGEIVKSSVGSFKSQATRFANSRKNFTVVKLAEIEAKVRGRQHDEIKPTLEVPAVDTAPRKARVRRVRREKPAA